MDMQRLNEAALDLRQPASSQAFREGLPLAAPYPERPRGPQLTMIERRFSMRPHSTMCG
jgi:hypothetical protein